MEDEQVLARNMIIEVDDDRAGITKIAGNPIKMSNLAEVEKREPAPKMGEHNAELLNKYLGYDEAQIKKLAEEGVI